MSSQSTNTGNLNLTVTFKVGTNLDVAQVQVQNRVAVALPQLPAGGAAAGSHRQEGVAGYHAGGRVLLARRVPRLAVHQQLRDACK